MNTAFQQVIGAKDDERVSRHYFDVFRLLQSPLGERAMQDRALRVDCARHARVFFNSPDFDFDGVVAGTFTLVPPPEMHALLARDYDDRLQVSSLCHHRLHGPSLVRPEDVTSHQLDQLVVASSGEQGTQACRRAVEVATDGLVR